MVLVFLSLLPLSACSGINREPVSKSGFYFDTFITITIYDGTNLSKEHLQEIFGKCFSSAETYENLFSRTKEGSDLWRINHAKGEKTPVDKETAALLSLALHYSELTSGAVDPSIGKVSSLWDFHADNPEKDGVLPEDSAIQEALQHVNYQKIHIFHGDMPIGEALLSPGNTGSIMSQEMYEKAPDSNDFVQNDEQDYFVWLEDPEMLLDLGFIAKGYIADRMKEVLLKEGVSSAIINLGANILTVGEKADGSPFQVGIQKPFGQRNEVASIEKVRDSSVVTSGNYERYFIKDGELYHHILNPETGYPVRNGLSSVTILSKNSADGDALSTSCFCLGIEDGIRLLEEINKNLPEEEMIEAVFIKEDGEIVTMEN